MRLGRLTILAAATLLASTVALSSAHADVGTAGVYDTPYIPTECYGSNASEFPSGNLFVAAGEGIWDNGAACGRQYKVRCISAEISGVCKPGESIRVKIVDYCATAVTADCNTTMALSRTAFEALTNRERPNPDTGEMEPVDVSFINIEFQQV